MFLYAIYSIETQLNNTQFGKLALFNYESCISLDYGTHNITYEVHQIKFRIIDLSQLAAYQKVACMCDVVKALFRSLYAKL